MNLVERLTGKGLDPVKNIVKTVSLSQFIEWEVDLLKIDVEGMELKVIKDLQTWDKLKFIKNILVEYHRDFINQENKLGVILELLEETGFGIVIDSAFPLPYDQYRSQASQTLYMPYGRLGVDYDQEDGTRAYKEDMATLAKTA